MRLQCFDRCWILVNWFIWATFIFSSSLSESWSDLDDQELLPDIWDRSVCFTLHLQLFYHWSVRLTNVYEIIHCSWQFHWNVFSRKPSHPNLVVGNVTLSVGAFPHSRWWGRVQFGCRINVTALTYSLFVNAPGCLSMCRDNTCCRSAPQDSNNCVNTQLLYKHQNYWLKTRHCLMRKHFSMKRLVNWQIQLDALE